MDIFATLYRGGVNKVESENEGVLDQDGDSVSIIIGRTSDVILPMISLVL